MQDWLTVIVVLLIVGILLDGWRRMRASRRDTIRVSRRARQYDSGDSEPVEEPYTSELPNGGARVVAKREVLDTPDTGGGSSVPNRDSIPQQVTLNLDESVPMLMESVEEQGEERTEPSFGEADPAPAAESRDEPELRQEPSFSALQDDEPAAAPDPEPLRSTEPTHAPEPERDAQMPDEVIIINIMAREGEVFVGESLLDVLLQVGMRYGDMNIFHRHARENGEGPVLFSLANMVKPGTFDLDNMASFQTPGISLFLTLPLAVDSIKAFDIMRDSAWAIADAMGGELKDENRSVMTRQTMEHCRQRIAEYERKRLSRAGA
ncbi:cell division protein ZipA [Gilvimarinus xylanilyticus]|uniref:Cell division protein ZipA n=1 Tax=Gilvimarinus xylanilyticus TaxID=2944139 RepID=A0A9X2HVI5_9GAMM|nr:cell division protein ZipA [Gilvimarinus xylanilyticus]MCP8898429.1 cell division protein ZipA [Gilvimarinus xylanilyticus]